MSFIPKLDTDTFKLISSGVLLVMGIVSSVLPFFIGSIKFMSILDSFSGGVFIGCALVHLFPEGIHELEHFEIPLGPLLSLLGFVLMFVLESFSSHSHAHDCCDGHDKHKEHDHDKKEKHKHNHGQHSTSASALYIALLFHSFVEAASIGVVREYKVIKTLIFALGGHYPAEVFSLGLQIFKSRISKPKYLIMMIFYSILTPATIMLADYVGKSFNDTVAGSAVAISAGIFIFIACHELGETLEKIHHGTAREKIFHLIAIFIGAAWMAGMALTEHPHDHHHHHGHEHHHHHHHDHEL